MASGVQIWDADTTHNTVSGNYIGINAAGTSALPNIDNGVTLSSGASSNTIGGTTAGERNIISGNGNGVWIEGTNTSNNGVTGNYIGLNASGTAAVGNTANGVGIAAGAQYNWVGNSTPGERNIISGNGGGVYITGPDTSYNWVRGNYIGTDPTGMTVIGQLWYGVQLGGGTRQNLIGGKDAGQGNVLSGNTYEGILIHEPDTQSNNVWGNLIGLNAAGTGALGNQLGIRLDSGAEENVIGGTDAGKRNIISGNVMGIGISGEATIGNNVIGNVFGTDAGRVQAVGEQEMGVAVWGGSSLNRIGPGNEIANHSVVGIVIDGAASLNNTITQNSLHDNSHSGIVNKEGGNAELAPPVITQFAGGNNVGGTACAGCVIEIFSDDANEGRVWEGTVTADGAGQFSFTKPGGFSLSNVTATATDAAGNTSEFSAEAPRVPPTITQVAPNQGNNDVPSEINILGSHFSTGITAALSTVPPTALNVRFGDPTQIVAVVPAGLPAGRYDLTVDNPGGGSAMLPGAYEVYGAASDDLFGYPYELWTDPQTLRAGESGGVGLVVHRQGGNSVLSNVVVRFYRGNPGQGGVVIGDGVIPLLSPNSSVSTPKVSWAPPAAGAYDLYAVIDPGNAIPETAEANNVVSRTVTVAGPTADTIAPHVDSFAINDGASLATSPAVTLDTTASDNPGGSGVASLLYLEYEYSQAANQWYPVQNSGWVTYATAQNNYPWELLPGAGMKYMQAWAADKAGNISLYPYRAYIDYVPATDHVEQGQVRVYRYTLAAGQVFAATLTPTTGDPDLYVWSPDFPTRPPWVSNQASGTDQVTFSAPVAGVYQIEVYGFTAADYALTFAAEAAGAHVDNLRSSASASKPERTTPALPPNSEPGMQIALPPPPVPVSKLYLPVVLRR